MTANTITGYTVRTNTHNAYNAPETRYVNLSGGEVENRGRMVHTGWIISIDVEGERYLVRTLSGSQYLLGEPATGTGTVDDAATLIRLALALLSSAEDQPGYHPIVLRGLLALDD